MEKEYNFKTVEKGILYRSSQPSPEFLSYLKENYGIKTVVNLRKRTRNFEKKALEDLEISLFPFPMYIKTLFSFKMPSKKGIFSFLEIFREKENLPVLLHCRKGKDRTGVMTAFFRFYVQKWPEKKIREEMKKKGVNICWRMFFWIKIKLLGQNNAY